MDTILTILKFIAISIGVLIALPIIVVLLGVAVSILGAVIEVCGIVFLFFVAAAASFFNAFLEAFFTPKNPRN